MADIAHPTKLSNQEVFVGMVTTSYKAINILRWIVFMPCAFLGAQLAWILINILGRFSLSFVGIYADSFLGQFYFNTAGSSAMGAAFVYIGTVISPSHRKIVAYILAGVGLITGGFGLFASVMVEDGWATWGAFCMIGGVGAVTYLIQKGELNIGETYRAKSVTHQKKEHQPDGSRMNDELTPQEHLKDINYEKMMICAECHEIYGFWNYRSKSIINDNSTCNPENMYYQKCSSKCKDQMLKPGIPPGEKNKENEKWPRFDFNEIVTLCYCCGQELLSSGSRWSVWFCEDCKKNVIRFNSIYQKRIIPIGRHSIMNGYILNVQKFEDGMDKAIEEFTGNVKDLSRGIEHLEKWRKIIMQKNFKALSYSEDILLNEYMLNVYRLSHKSEAFEHMRTFFEK